MSNSEITFIVGFGLVKTIRKLLKKAEFYGAQWFETKSLLSSEFTVIGEDNIIIPIRNWLNQIKKDEKQELLNRQLEIKEEMSKRKGRSMKYIATTFILGGWTLLCLCIGFLSCAGG